MEDESRICKEGENGVVPDMQRCAVEEPGHGFARGRLEDVWSRICKGSEGNREARRGINKLCLDTRKMGAPPLRIPRRAAGNGAGGGESRYRQIADVAIKKADQYREGEINSLIIDSDSETRHLMARFRKPH